MKEVLVDFLTLAMDTAKSLEADYADIRIQKSSTEMIFLRNLSLKNTSLNEIYGYGIRVSKKGAWGFAHNNVFTADAVKKTVKKAFAIAKESGRVKYGKGLVLAHERGYIDSYKTPYCLDPFEVPLSEKVELMLEVNKTMLNFAEIKLAVFMLECRKDEKLLLPLWAADWIFTQSILSQLLQQQQLPQAIAKAVLSVMVDKAEAGNG